MRRILLKGQRWFIPCWPRSVLRLTVYDFPSVTLRRDLKRHRRPEACPSTDFERYGQL